MKKKKQFFGLVLASLILLIIESSVSATTPTPTPINKPNTQVSAKSPTPTPKRTSDNKFNTETEKVGEINSQKNLSNNLGNEEETSSTQKRTDKQSEPSEKSPESWSSFLVTYLLYGFVGLVLLGGIISGVFFQRRNKQRERGEITSAFGDLRKKQSDIAREVKDLTEVSKNLSQQMAQHKAAIGGLKQVGQNVSSYAAPPKPPINTFQPPKEESPFPVAVDDYLAKSQNGATPVKYDYKERMLVQDDAREGGLLIVRDGGGSLYLVPSFGFFQTKSDYTNYFERYFACARPGSGSVWIRQPATVSAVNGGWQLNNQGELEVR